MAWDYCSVTVEGRVQPSDAETRFTPNGDPIVSFRFVSSKSKRNRETNEWDDESTWFRVTCFGKLGERIVDKAVKGARLLVVGSMKQTEWTANDGSTRTSLEIVANDVIALGDRPRAAGPEAVGAGVGSTRAEPEELPF